MLKTINQKDFPEFLAWDNALCSFVELLTAREDCDILVRKATSSAIKAYVAKESTQSLPRILQLLRIENRLSQRWGHAR